ncbi:hypothetical protein BV20DRAFT_956144 [Pilatotrama ljubarskyi]|nr:hypothetical protein BV20DRAFT_956144 [Pilatotrama ljubarskyi]
MSQESLPLYSQVSQEQPRATPFMQAQKLFLVLGAPAAPQYVPIPTSGSDEDLEKGLLTAAEVSGVNSPPESPTSATIEAQVPPVPSRLTGHALRRAFTNLVWSVRMGLYLALWGVGVALICSFLGFILGMVTLFAWIAPFNDFPAGTAFAACAAGAPIVGAAAGFSGFLCLCVRRARMTAAAKEDYTRLEARRRAGDFEAKMDDRSEPSWEEWGTVIAGAALLSPLAFVLGMAIVPGFATIGQGVGFGFGHAVAIGVWGICVPFIPSLIGAVFTTLLSCDPMSGAEAGCSFWAAWADAYSHRY